MTSANPRGALRHFLAAASLLWGGCVIAQPSDEMEHAWPREAIQGCAPAPSPTPGGSALYQLRVRNEIDLPALSKAFPSMPKRTMPPAPAEERFSFALFRFAPTGEAIRMSFNADFDVEKWNLPIHHLPPPEENDPWYWFDGSDAHQIVILGSTTVVEKAPRKSSHFWLSVAPLYEPQLSRRPAISHLDGLFPKGKTLKSLPPGPDGSKRLRLVAVDVNSPQWERFSLLDFACYPDAGPLSIRSVVYLQDHQASNRCYRVETPDWVDAGTLGRFPQKKTEATFYVLPGDALPAEAFHVENVDGILKLLDERAKTAKHFKVSEFELIEHDEHPWKPTDLQKNYPEPIIKRAAVGN